MEGHAIVSVQPMFSCPVVALWSTAVREERNRVRRWVFLFQCTSLSMTVLQFSPSLRTQSRSGSAASEQLWVARQQHRAAAVQRTEYGRLQTDAHFTYKSIEAATWVPVCGVEQMWAKKSASYGESGVVPLCRSDVRFMTDSLDFERNDSSCTWEPFFSFHHCSQS